MKHEWIAVQPDDKMRAMATHGSRRCLNCGKVQDKWAEQNWGRVTGYRWAPLVGRCKPEETDIVCATSGYLGRIGKATALCGYASVGEPVACAAPFDYPCQHKRAVQPEY